MKAERAVGFEPVYTEESVALILGSFPSVKSRKIEFYYGNPQNRFWKVVCGFFGEDIPESTAGKIDFLMRRNIALWDIVTACDIVGSSDSSIKNEEIADITSLLEKTKIRRIYCNGKKAYELLLKNFPNLEAMATCLPSTSPANGRFGVEPWQAALREIERG